MCREFYLHVDLHVRSLNLYIYIVILFCSAFVFGFQLSIGPEPGGGSCWGAILFYIDTHSFSRV